MPVSIATRTTESITRKIPTLRRILSERRSIGMWRVVRYLADQARASLGQNQPVANYKHYKWGLAPSQPGSPPRGVRGRLAGSITTSVENPKLSKTVGYVGTPLAYGRFLELGAYIPARTAKRRAMMFAVASAKPGRIGKRDRLKNLVFTRFARGFHLRPRPWLKPLIVKHAKFVTDILGSSITMNLTIR